MARQDSARGKWLVIGMIGGAIVLGLIGLRFRQFMPRVRPATAPVTQPVFSATDESN
jgi:hypothetical protein